MVTRSTLIRTAALVAFAWSADAQQTLNKVGVISIQGAIVGTKDGQKASQELDRKVVPKQKEFQSRQSELAQLQDQYSKSGSVMSEDKRNQMARDIDEKKKRLDRDMQDAEEDSKGEQQKLLQSLGGRIMAVIEKYAKDNGYSMILDVSNPNTPVLYASSGIDITQDIVSLYDKTSSNGVPAPTTAPAPKTSTPGPSSSTKPPGTTR
jgi:outer membrane protein